MVSPQAALFSVKRAGAFLLLCYIAWAFFPHKRPAQIWLTDKTLILLSIVEIFVMMHASPYHYYSE